MRATDSRRLRMMDDLESKAGPRSHAASAPPFPPLPPLPLPWSLPLLSFLPACLVCRGRTARDGRMQHRPAR